MRVCRERRAEKSAEISIARVLKRKRDIQTQEMVNTGIRITSLDGTVRVGGKAEIWVERSVDVLAVMNVEVVGVSYLR